MASRSLDFIVNVQGGTLVSSFTSTVQGQLPSFIFGDETPVSVRLVEPSGVSARPWREIDLTDQTVRIGIGVPGSSPTAGTFTLTYGANTTSALAYNASAAQVAAALNALASIVSAGGVTVTASGATYKVVFDDVGVRTALTANVASISPTSGAYISTVLEGSVSAQAIYLFRLEAMPAAYVELADPLPSAAVVVATVRAGATGVSEIQTVALSPVPYDGTYTLTVGANETTSLAWNADAATIQAALVALASVGAGNATVSGEFPAFTVTFAASLGNIAATTGNASALIVPTGRSGVLSNNTTGVAELLASRSRVDATLEVEIVDDISGDTWTPLQVSCTLREDVIPNSPSSQTGGPVYLLESVAAARYVRYDAVQTLTAPQKTQALANIGGNNITSATSSDGTATLSTSTITTGTLTVSTSGVFNATSYTFGTGAATAMKTALAIASADITFNSSIEFTGSGRDVEFSGNSCSVIFQGTGGGLVTNGINSTISTTGTGSHIFTSAAGSNIYTAGGGYIQTSSTFQFISGGFVSTLSSEHTNTRAIAFPDASGNVVLDSNTVTLTNKTLTNPTVNNFTEGVVSIGNSGTSQTLALTNGTFQTVTLTGNCTFTMPTATAGKSFILKVMTGAGGFTATFTSVKWAGSTTPTITTTASRYDLVSFIADGSAWSGSIIQNFT